MRQGSRREQRRGDAECAGAGPQIVVSALPRPSVLLGVQGLC